MIELKNNRHGTTVKCKPTKRILDGFPFYELTKRQVNRVRRVLCPNNCGACGVVGDGAASVGDAVEYLDGSVLIALK